MIEIPLSQQGKHKGKYIAIVDDIDADLADFMWSYQGGYAMRKPDGYKGKSVLLHRIILSRILLRSLTDNEFVDHINMNRADNRRENLRLATRSQNGANRNPKKVSSTGYRGVYKNRNKYIVVIRINGKSKSFGVFERIDDAIEKHRDKMIELFGEYTRVKD